MSSLATHPTIAEIEWLDAYHSFCKRCIYDADREILTTLFDGHYGYAGVVIAINGSPMAGTMLVKSRNVREGAPLDHVAYISEDGIQVMYVLDDEYQPHRLRPYHHPFRASKGLRLWNATRDLLRERSLL